MVISGIWSPLVVSRNQDQSKRFGSICLIGSDTDHGFHSDSFFVPRIHMMVRKSWRHEEGEKKEIGRDRKDEKTTEKR